MRKKKNCVRQRADLSALTESPARMMPKVEGLPQSIGKIIDDIERIREELLMVQNALQKMESVQSATPLLKIPK